MRHDSSSEEDDDYEGSVSIGTDGRPMTFRLGSGVGAGDGARNMGNVACGSPFSGFRNRHFVGSSVGKEYSSPIAIHKDCSGASSHGRFSTASAPQTAMFDNFHNAEQAYTTVSGHAHSLDYCDQTDYFSTRRYVGDNAVGSSRELVSGSSDGAAESLNNSELSLATSGFHSRSAGGDQTELKDKGMLYAGDRNFDASMSQSSLHEAIQYSQHHDMTTSRETLNAELTQQEIEEQEEALRKRKLQL